ncbi:hypothetical protein M6B38_170690 [Iris pallida]|uniref:Uncharacterized protein n=1 Tax=Iris pallida TaxID=29817 RepID=A0AAX6ETM4_IRIPA|nr:hypothetical protein M6B38_170690 [Iris pallida]
MTPTVQRTTGSRLVLDTGVSPARRRRLLFVKVVGGTRALAGLLTGDDARRSTACASGSESAGNAVRTVTNVGDGGGFGSICEEQICLRGASKF